MASFDENGKYIKTNWKAGDKITATKLNKIEESIEAVNDNDISRHVETDARLDELESYKQEINAKVDALEDVVDANKDATDLEIYSINSHMTLLDKKIDDGVAEVEAIASTVDGKLTMVTDVIDAIPPMLSDLSSSISEELTNNNVTSFKAGTSNVTGIDLTHQMEQSIVTLDDIEGKTEVVENITDHTQKLNNTRIKLLYTLDENDQFNYFNKDNLEMGVFDNGVNYHYDESAPIQTIHVYSHIAIQGSCLLVEVTGLTPGEVYCLTVENIVVDNGVSAIAIYDNMKHNVLSNTVIYHSEDPTQSYNGLVVKASSDRLGFIFYSNTGLDVPGDVTYQGITLRKVKEYSPMDLTLRSLPNGIKDEIKHDKLIKRVESYTLNGTEDWVIADNSKTNTVSFACSLSNATPVNKEVISLNSNKYKSASDAELYAEDGIGLAVGGLNSNQLLFRVDRGLDTVEKLKYHLANVEKDLIIEYAIQPEVYDIDLSIVCDPDDIVYINTNRTISCSHQVQLSTKSQVEETQKQIIKSNKSIKSIWQRIKNLTDAKVSIGENGYVKFPTALGGLCIQWGFIQATGDGTTASLDQTFNLSIPISTMCYCGTGDAQCGTNSWRNLLVNISRQNTNTYRVTWKDTSGAKITTCSARWLIIGK